MSYRLEDQRSQYRLDERACAAGSPGSSMAIVGELGEMDGPELDEGVSPAKI